MDRGRPPEKLKPEMKKCWRDVTEDDGDPKKIRPYDSLHLHQEAVWEVQV